MEILDVVPDNEADFWECEYIQNFRERGFDLTNIADGGGVPMRGKKHTEESKAKIRAASLKRKHTPEELKKMSLSQLGEKHHNFGKKNSPESNVKNSVSNSGERHHMFGKKHSLETIAKMRAVKLGKKCTAETRAKMQTAHLRRKNHNYGKRKSN